MSLLQEEEWFPVVDENGIMISKAPRSICHDGKSMLLHPVVHIHFFNEDGELFLQKRAMSKDLLPGFWDTSVGGHVSVDEGIEEALKREVREELGIQGFEYNFLKRYVWQSPTEKELVFSFRGRLKEEPQINRDEIEEGRFWPVETIRENLGEGLFTPNFEYEFSNVL
jgi:isopentenyldiphosphate isomerase